MLEQQSPLTQTRKCKLQHPHSRVDVTFSNSKPHQVLPHPHRNVMLSSSRSSEGCETAQRTCSKDDVTCAR